MRVISCQAKVAKGKYWWHILCSNGTFKIKSIYINNREKFDYASLCMTS